MTHRAPSSSGRDARARRSRSPPGSGGRQRYWCPHFESCRESRRLQSVERRSRSGAHATPKGASRRWISSPRAGFLTSGWSARSRIWPASISASRGKGSGSAVEKGGIDDDSCSHRAGDRAAKLAKDDPPAGSSQLLLRAASVVDDDLRLPLLSFHARPEVRGVLLSRLRPPWHLCHDGSLWRIAGRNLARARPADRVSPADGSLLDASRVDPHRQDRCGGDTAAPAGVRGGASRDLARRAASDRSPRSPRRARSARPLRLLLCEPLLLGRAYGEGTGEHGGLRPRREHAAPLYEQRASPFRADARLPGGACAMESSLAGGERATGGAPPRADARCCEPSSASRTRHIPLRAGVADNERLVAKQLPRLRRR